MESKKKNTTACWSIELNCNCPKCDRYIDLFQTTGISDSMSDRDFELCEYYTERTQGVEVMCPKCEHEFKVDFDY